MQIIDDLETGDPSYRLLYSKRAYFRMRAYLPCSQSLVSPERFCSAEIRRLLTAVYNKGKLNRLVVDEVSALGLVGWIADSLNIIQAHCISVCARTLFDSHTARSSFCYRNGDMTSARSTASWGHSGPSSLVSP